MAKRNAQKQATREQIELTDPVCRKLADLADEADLLLLTEGGDYEVSDDPAKLSAMYGQRLAYLPVLLAELTDFRVRIVIHESMSIDVEAEPTQPEPDAESAPEEISADGHDNDDETE